MTPAPSYLELDGTHIVATVRRLEQRIGERFPTAGLRGVAAHLRVAAEAALTRAPALRRPLLALRAGAAALALLLVAGVLSVVAALRLDTRIHTITDLVQSSSRPSTTWCSWGSRSGSWRRWRAD